MWLSFSLYSSIWFVGDALALLCGVRMGPRGRAKSVWAFSIGHHCRDWSDITLRQAVTYPSTRIQEASQGKDTRKPYVSLSTVVRVVRRYERLTEQTHG